MADRALRDGDPEEEVFDLSNDDRWQARLEEARARRAVALQQKAEKSGTVEKPKARRKPWEEEGQFADDEDDIFEPIEPVFLPGDPEDGTDFSDRVDNLRKKVGADKPKSDVAVHPAFAAGGKATSRHEIGGNSKPAGVLEGAEKLTGFSGAKTAAPTVSVEPVDVTDEAEERVEEASATAKKESVADRYVKALSPDFTPVRPYVPETRSAPEPVLPRVPNFSAPPPEPMSDDGTRIAEEYAATMTAEAEAKPEAAVEVEKPAKRRGTPALLLAAVCVMAALPFTNMIGPLEKGPIEKRQVAPGLAFEPALGLPRPMNAFPRETVSGEWRPASKVTPRPPVAVASGEAAVFVRELDGLPTIEAGDGPFGELRWAAIAPGGYSSETPGIAVPRADRLPGVDEPVAIEKAEAAPVLPEPLSLLRVTILVPSTKDPAIADRIAQDVQARGHELATVRPVNVKISQPNVRFFHDEDRGEAARLAQAYGARLRDFTSFRPSPNKGTTEIWLDGDRIAPVVARPVPVPVEVQPEPEAPAGVEAEELAPPVSRPPNLLQRIGSIFGGPSQDAVGPESGSVVSGFSVQDSLAEPVAPAPDSN